MSKRTARLPSTAASGTRTSFVRCGVVLLLIALGIAWMAVYINVAKDSGDALTQMADLGRWNYLIGFGLIYVGMTVAAHKSTPLGRGQGVVVGMLFSFLFGLVWILVFYFMAEDITKVPVMKDLDNYNLVVGVGFMAVGFTYATKWE